MFSITDPDYFIGTTTSKFYSTLYFAMDRLPFEVLHAVISCLEPKDVPNVRLVNKATSIVGCQYLLPVFRLCLLPKSFDRLEAVSNHPVLSRYLREIVHECSLLYPLRSKKDWEKMAIVQSGFSCRPFEAPSPPPADASDRSIRLHNRREQRARQVGILQVVTKESWKIYKDYVSFQSDLLATTRHVEFLKTMMARFPRLESIVQEDRGHLYLSSASMKAYSDGLVVPPRQGGRSETEPGVRNLQVLLQATAASNTKLRRLEVKNHHWWSFNPIINGLSNYRDFQNTLSSLHLTLCISSYVNRISNPRGFAPKSLRELLLSLPEMEELSLIF